MQTSPAFQFYPADFLAGTVFMTPAEVGGFIRLLAHQWQQGSIPPEPDRLARLTGLPAAKHGPILEKFQLAPDGKNLINARLETIRQEQLAYRAKQAANGSKGGRPPGSGNQKPETRNQEPAENPPLSQPLPLASATENPNESPHLTSPQPPNPPIKIPPADTENPPANPAPSAAGYQPDQFDTILALQRRINALRPAWAKLPHWNAEEEHAITEHYHNLTALEDQDWRMLAFWLRWVHSASNANAGREAARATSRRTAFIADIAANLDRATTHWKQSGSPKLNPDGTKAGPNLKVLPKPPPEEPPPTPGSAAFLQTFKAFGGELPPRPTVTTKPAVVS